MTSTVLILGASGRLGGALAQAFAAAGWRVLAQRRSGAPSPDAMTGIEWVQAEAQDTARLVQAAAGACAVVHAMNPPYTTRAWHAQAPALMQAAIDVALALNATLLFPGNVYNFGAAMPTVLKPETAQRPSTTKGQIRVELEQQLWRASQTQGLKAVLIRAGDYFGAGTGSWLDLVMAKRLAKGQVCWPTAGDQPHAWAYLPDLAQAFVRVAQTPCAQAGGHFERLHFAGHTVSRQDWLAALTVVAREQGWLTASAALRCRGVPWALMRLLAFFNPTVASLMEMRYLWERPHALDGAALAQQIGVEPHTPFLSAVRSAVADLALGAPQAASPRWTETTPSLTKGG